MSPVDPAGAAHGSVAHLQAGAWLRSLREAAGLTQREVATGVGVGFHTHVAQIEAGYGRIAPDRYADWASVLRVPLPTLH